MPMKTNARMPPTKPNRPNTTERSWDWERRYGLSRLSIVLTSFAPHAATNMPHQKSPWTTKTNHIATSPYMKGGPAGRNDSTNVKKPSRRAWSIPAIQKPRATSRP